ncbi:hypothetical protein OBBRIDRAFT_543176 [Obba rivulosa]|uniref:Acyl-CoA dehydrogenase n=1 Tax=Obba rivulosa TaxID=1052685 RepID=A0A8E2B2V3_9APHY|nr:hypothetical protein OBBRIDRAFT_543176 [Obba rivulosa]
MRVEDGFQPVPFNEDNAYTADPVLPALLKRLLSSAAFADINADLRRFGGEVMLQMRALSRLAEPPRLLQYNQWGQRIDELQTSEGWRGLQALMQREGITGLFYERKHREYSRLHGFAKLLVAGAESQVIDCPLSMTDGCARVIELMGTQAAKEDILPRLTSRDPAIAFTAGQWMTERLGGSDVSRTETVATPVPDSGPHPYGPQYILDGFKWFSSATDSDIALALARTGDNTSGSRGLSLFLVPLRDPLLRAPGAVRPPALSNHIYIHRLKNKIGTHIVPTAELSINGARAYRIGEPGAGVRGIAAVLNITRMHCVANAVGSLRKCLATATAYANVRTVEGGRKLLRDKPLHVAELAKASVVYRALTHLFFGTVLLLGKAECGVASEEETLRLRLLTPAVKAFAADRAYAASVECLTMLGGEGYMEENGLGRALRDSLVEKIWEGTVTVMSLDLVRATSKGDTLVAFAAWANRLLSACPPPFALAHAAAIGALRSALAAISSTYERPIPELVPRPALFVLAHVAAALHLLEHALWVEAVPADAEVFRRWVTEAGLDAAVAELGRAKDVDERTRVRGDAEIVFGRGCAKAHL